LKSKIQKIRIFSTKFCEARMHHWGDIDNLKFHVRQKNKFLEFCLRQFLYCANIIFFTLTVQIHNNC
jgi:hypothetical protein